MNYKFNYQTTAMDLWQFSMYRTYGSMVGLVNIIFTIAMLLLALKFWVQVGILMKIALVFALCLFTIIQPLAVYNRAKKQAATLPDEVEISFDNKGIHAKANNRSTNLGWSTIKGISKKPTMLIIISANQHGFILSNKVLGEEKEAFYHYLISKANI